MTASLMASRLLDFGYGTIERMLLFTEMYPYVHYFKSLPIEPPGMSEHMLHILNSPDYSKWYYEVACYPSCPPENERPNKCIREYELNGMQMYDRALPDGRLCDISIFFDGCDEHHFRFNDLKEFGEVIVPIVGRLELIAQALANQYAAKYNEQLTNMEEYIVDIMWRMDGKLQERAGMDENLINHVKNSVCNPACAITQLPNGGYGTPAYCDYRLDDDFIMPVVYSNYMCEAVNNIEKCIHVARKEKPIVYIIILVMIVVLLLIITFAIKCCIKCYRNAKLLKDLENSSKDVSA